ncbi:MAG: type 4a pilus biogenesis protein PilO [Gammaproteobacteria bacterium]|nr:type 4a pilus biogenesis protein PilO [Gammaproteobacteria bacterium]
MDWEQIQNFDLNDIDWENVGDWPLAGRLVVFAVAFAGIIAGGYYYIVQDKLTQLDQIEREEQTLREQFALKQRRAANLEAYKQQLEEMRVSFGAMLRQLPGKTEVDNLLVDISQAGLAAGLEQELFQPSAEQPRDFYAELPISMRLTGSFHQFAEFASSVAALPRIVTLHDISIDSTNPATLRMIVTAKTYRYLEEGGGT